jgi:hypothetical protein
MLSKHYLHKSTVFSPAPQPSNKHIHYSRGAIIYITTNSKTKYVYVECTEVLFQHFKYLKISAINGAQFYSIHM